MQCTALRRVAPGDDDADRIGYAVNTLADVLTEAEFDEVSHAVADILARRTVTR